jgi:hypothetical protein
MYEDLEELCETLSEELHSANSKLRNGKMNSGDLEYIDKLTHALKSVTILKEMKGGSQNDGSYRSYEERRSYEGNSMRGRRRDSMGRYSRDNEELMNDLQMLADKAPDPQTKAEIQKFMRTMGG